MLLLLDTLAIANPDINEKKIEREIKQNTRRYNK
jgi:hypothetical protein